ncbi:nuclear transport factor 2 family protein [Sphingobium sufflavum]|uniref:nuclear transport factor 2 family protein n=1 Tax=Sphingobium sufflavum TaxID=1129547 RepID=UPI001F2C2DFD|nr:nuclear transport factor 2 family protein [Sphingobium sufflavum]MCE7797150.1 nuclear transport factor 2 family protein [Sphingobium sufflavum]
MTESERLVAADAIRQVKARYFRGVDTGDADLVKGILAEDCELDYRGCCTDPATGRDFLPAMNVVLRGRESWQSDGMAKFGIVSVHQGHNVEIDFASATFAAAIWSMTDRLWFPPGSPFGLMTGHGHYHETYEKVGDRWLIKSIRITRIRVEAG